VLAARALHQLRQLSQPVGPVTQPVTLQLAGDGLRDGSAHRCGELVLQRGEVVAARDHGAPLVLDRERQP